VTAEYCSRTGWHKAVGESRFAALGHELMAEADFRSHRVATLAITAFIERWYNQERLHIRRWEGVPHHAADAENVLCRLVNDGSARIMTALETTLRRAAEHLRGLPCTCAQNPIGSTL
jgi:hypothetical protein